jgi:hypothetical protein
MDTLSTQVGGIQTVVAPPPPTQPSSAPLTMSSNLRVAPVPDEDCFLMPRRHWSRIRSRVGGLADPVSFVGNLGWTSVGIGAGGFVGLIPWLPAYGQLPDTGRLDFAWVSPALWFIGIGGAGVALVCHLLSRRVREVQKYNATMIVEDMDAIAEPYGSSAGVSTPPAVGSPA